MNESHIEMHNLNKEELALILGGGPREANAVLSGASGAVQGAMACVPAGPYVIAACALGGALYGGFWGYVFSK